MNRHLLSSDREIFKIAREYLHSGLDKDQGFGIQERKGGYKDSSDLVHQIKVSDLTTPSLQFIVEANPRSHTFKPAFCSGVL